MATGKVDDIFEKNFMTAAKFSVEIESIVKEGDLLPKKVKKIFKSYNVKICKVFFFNFFFNFRKYS